MTVVTLLFDIVIVMIVPVTSGRGETNPNSNSNPNHVRPGELERAAQREHGDALVGRVAALHAG